MLIREIFGYLAILGSCCSVATALMTFLVGVSATSLSCFDGDTRVMQLCLTPVYNTTMYTIHPLILIERTNPFIEFWDRQGIFIAIMFMVSSIVSTVIWYTYDKRQRYYTY